jgi:uncharacterized protein (DUF58 family)
VRRRRASRTRVGPTAFGLKAAAFYAVITATFFAIPYNNLFFLLLAFLSVAGALGCWWGWRNVAGASGEVAAVPPMPAGTPLVVRARLRPRRAATQWSCTIAVGGDWLALPPCSLVRGSTAVEGSIGVLPRGRHPVAGACIESTYPYGLLRFRRAIEAPREIVVYPAPASAGECSAQLAGAGHGARFAEDHSPSGLRDFRAGDEPRLVHWKASARRGELVVREHDRDARAACEVVLDRRCEPAALEAALSVVAALALRAAAKKEPLTLRTQGAAGTYGPGQRPLDALWELLAELQPLEPAGPAPAAGSAAALRLPAARARPLALQEPGP